MTPNSPRRARWAAIMQQLLLAAPVRLWALILAGLPLTTIDCWLIWIIWRGGWALPLQPQQLELLGYLAMAHVAALLVVLVALASVKIEAETKLGKLVIGAADADHDAPPPPPAA